MNKKTRTGIIILFSCLIFILSILIGIEINKRMDDPEFCISCHEMQPYYSSYLNPDNGSILLAHKLNCIQCHSSRNTYNTKKEILIKILSYNLNLSDSFKSKELKPDCSKCHSISPVLNHSRTDMTNCTYCHWAHEPLKLNLSLNYNIITYGPHKNQTCLQCHGTSFKIPQCVNCHTGHGGQKLEKDLCLTCHKDPHIPTIPGILRNNTVNFTKDLPFSACQPCHEKEYFNLTDSFSRHNDMQTCSICHVKHGSKPKCYNCHKAMKTERHLTNLKCNDCHKRGGKVIKCEECHDLSHGWSANSAIVYKNN